MTDITIPDEVVEAAARAAWGVLHVEDEWLLKEKARAAILAALKAWPGAWDDRMEGQIGRFLILPLTHETDA